MTLEGTNVEVALVLTPKGSNDKAQGCLAPQRYRGARQPRDKPPVNETLKGFHTVVQLSRDDANPMKSNRFYRTLTGFLVVATLAQGRRAPRYRCDARQPWALSSDPVGVKNMSKLHAAVPWR